MTSGEELVGRPADDVPTIDPGQYCNAKKTNDGVFQGYCRARAGKGTDHVGQGRCKHHGGASLSGPDNPAYKHGAFSKHFRSDLTDEEKAALEDGMEALEEPEKAREIAIEMAMEAAIKYKRSGDTRHQREFRQLCETFNIAPSDELSIDLDGLEAAFMQDLREANSE